MAEPIKLVLTNTGPYDGSSPINITRADLTGSGPVYEAQLNGGGVVDASFGGLVSPTTAKLVSIAIDSDFPGAFARVTSPDSPTMPIRQVGLNTRYQRMFMAGGEVLRIVWNGESRTRRVLIILQDLSERECTPYMRVEHRPVQLMSRYLIEVQGGGTFDFGPTPLQPIWQFDQALKIRRAAVASGIGYVSVGDLTNGHYRQGIYVWARMSNSPGNALQVGLKAPFATDYKEVTVAGNMEWSKPVWMSATDKMGFRTNQAQGAVNYIELDVSPVQIRRVTGAV